VVPAALKRPTYGGATPPVAMDLKGAAWMARSLNQSVSCVHLTDHGHVLAGGWDGALAMWDVDGTLVWRVETGDRISALALNDATVVATSGLCIVALDRLTGATRWSVALEGSADEVVLWKDDVLAVSSVYDIEHNDFLESAVWCFSIDGEQRWVERMDERPWTVFEAEGTVLAGLGRPRCGWLDIGTSPPFTHATTKSPITCGTAGRTQGLFGLTDGTVVSSKGPILSTESDGLAWVSCLVEGYAATTEQGTLTVRTSEGTEQWQHHGAPVHAQREGLMFNDGYGFWVARSNGQGSRLTIHQGSNGDVLATLETARVRSMTVCAQRLAIGCDDGTVLVWEQGLLIRRMEKGQPTGTLPADDRKSALQAKLRALRG